MIEMTISSSSSEYPAAWKGAWRHGGLIIVVFLMVILMVVVGSDVSLMKPASIQVAFKQPG